MNATLAGLRGETGATSVRFTADDLIINLTDGREVTVPFRKVARLRWLAEATPQQLADWCLEAGGLAIYWDQLNDGIWIPYLLSTANLN